MNHAVQGFLAAGIAAGIKKNGNMDLGLLVSERPAVAAGVFTKNRVTAACVRLDRERLAASGTCRAVIVNSGNANCCTGDAGMDDAVAMAKAAAGGQGIDEEQVLVASTGVTGQKLPVEKVEAAIPELTRRLSAEEGLAGFARAIMTTDSVPKVVTRKGEIGGSPYPITGIAKGAGMIRPDMATMLCFVATDIGIGRDDLRRIVAETNEKSFNRITIDGDTSTNDTLLVLANGMSGAEVRTNDDKAAFSETLEAVLVELAKMCVRDGEGATKLVEISVANAASREDARRIADTVANSNLVKTAFFGQDANWGRIVAAMGRAGVAFDPERIDLYFDDVLLVENGLYAGQEAENAATRVLEQPEFRVCIDLKAGMESEIAWTCDFSIDYVKINADYRS